MSSPSSAENGAAQQELQQEEQQHPRTEEQVTEEELPPHDDEGFSSPLDIASSPIANEAYERGEMHVETQCCGAVFHHQVLRAVSIIVCSFTLFCGFVLCGASIWVFEEISSIKTSSCCLPLSCNETAVEVLQSRVARLRKNGEDNGLCRAVSPNQARAMGCLSEIAVAADTASNCTIAGIAESGAGPTQCRDRSHFPTGFAQASAALGLASSVCLLLFLIVVGSDGFFWIFNRAYSGRFAVQFFLFALVLLCNGAGIALAVRPFQMALQRGQGMPVEIEPATSSRGEKNIFMTPTVAGTFVELHYSSGCGSLSRTRAQLVGFVDFSSGWALIGSFYLLLVSHGMVFLFATLSLALSWQAGGLLNVLMWKESADSAIVRHDKLLKKEVAAKQIEHARLQDAALAERIIRKRLNNARSTSAAADRRRDQQQQQRLPQSLSPRQLEEPFVRSSSHASNVAPTSRSPSHMMTADEVSTQLKEHHPSESRPKFMTSVRNSDLAHPKSTDDEILARMNSKNSAASASHRGWRGTGSPIQVDSTGRLLI